MDVEVVSDAPSPGPNGISSPTFTPIDPARVADHVVLLLEAALGATREELEAPGSLLSKTQHSDTIQRCGRFATDSHVALYIQKSLAPTPSLENGAAEHRT